MQKSDKTGIFLAISAAALYALNSPLSKLLLSYYTFYIALVFMILGAYLSSSDKPLFKKK